MSSGGDGNAWKFPHFSVWLLSVVNHQIDYYLVIPYLQQWHNPSLTQKFLFFWVFQKSGVGHPTLGIFWRAIFSAMKRWIKMAIDVLQCPSDALFNDILLVRIWCKLTMFRFLSKKQAPETEISFFIDIFKKLCFFYFERIHRLLK